jgi:hypothetical protein
MKTSGRYREKRYVSSWVSAGGPQVPVPLSAAYISLGQQYYLLHNLNHIALCVTPAQKKTIFASILYALVRMYVRQDLQMITITLVQQGEPGVVAAFKEWIEFARPKGQLRRVTKTVT